MEFISYGSNNNLIIVVVVIVKLIIILFIYLNAIFNYLKKKEERILIF